MPTAVTPRFVDLVRRGTVPELALALTAVRTLAGAERIYHAERAGLNRPVVIHEAARRIAELGGTEPLGHGPRLVLAAEVS